MAASAVTVSTTTRLSLVFEEPVTTMVTVATSIAFGMFKDIFHTRGRPLKCQLLTLLFEHLP